MNLDFDANIEYKEDFISEKGPEHDPLVKEFLAFCKLNSLEKQAAALLSEKIDEKKGIF